MRRPAEDVELRRLDLLERRTVEARERGDAESAADVELVHEPEAVREIGARAAGLERHQRAPARRAAARGDVGLRHLERRELVLRQVDAAQAPVLGDVAHDVDQLERHAEGLGPLLVLRPVDGDARDADRARDPPAIAVQLVERCVAGLPEILESAVDQVVEGAARNRIADARVRERDQHRASVRARVQRGAQPLEPVALLLRGQVAVGHVVDLPREGVDRRDRTAFRARQHHDPVGEVAGAPPRDPLDLGVCLLGRRHRTRLATASRARRAREGRGRPAKTS